jgi:hypothetical protein
VNTHKQYFNTTFRLRLRNLKTKVHSCIEPFKGKEKEFEKWLDKEIAFFLLGSKNQIKEIGDSKQPEFMVLVSKDFLHGYLLGEFTDDSITELLAKVPDA